MDPRAGLDVVAKRKGIVLLRIEPWILRLSYFVA
jgi:hypothetical protein